MQKNEIKITETETEYWLFIPRGQKERARNIKGRPQRNWDSNGKHWFYPRNIRMYKALKEEFSDDLTASSSFTPPQSFDKREKEREKQELKLWKEITQLNETLSKINPTGEINESIKSLREMLSTRDEEIQSLKDQIYGEDRENNELREKINTQETTIDDLRQTLSEKQELISKQKAKIQSLNNAIDGRDRERDRLKKRNGVLEEQVNERKATIGNLRETLSEKESEIWSLNNSYAGLKVNVRSHCHKKIKNIAIKATGDKPAFREYFSNLNISNDLPIVLRTWLEDTLKTDQTYQLDLHKLIRAHADFNVEYSLKDKFDKYDVHLADVIRTQRNLAHPERMDERTKTARIYCCLFAAALLSSKLPEP